MVERRDYERRDVTIKVELASLARLTDVVAEACLVDCSRVGAKAASPVPFEEGEPILIRIDRIGGTFKIEGKVLHSKEESMGKVRFEKTYVVSIEYSELSENDWQTLVELGKS